MARAAGVQAIGVAWGYHEAGELDEAGAAAVIEAYRELAPLVARLKPVPAE